MSAATEPTKEKLTAKKLVDLTPSLLGRLNGHAGTKRHGSANDIARRAIETECDRLDAITSVESQRMEKLKQLAEASGEGIDAVLERLTREIKEPELPLATPR